MLLVKAKFYQNNGEVLRAVEIYDRLAREGDKIAQCELSLIYLNGKSVALDSCRAYGLALASAEQKYIEAYSVLAVMYEKGLCVDVDYIKSVEYYKKAIEGGLIGAAHNLGVIYYHGKLGKSDYKKSFKYFKMNLNDPLSVYYIGRQYYWGNGVIKDYNKAERYLLKASRSGVPGAMVLLAMIYYKGYLGQKDYNASKVWLNKASLDGYMPGVYYLGVLYATNDFPDKDLRKAFNLISKSARSGYSLAEYMLGYMYENGIGTKSNYSLARAWYRKASIKGNKKARSRLLSLKKRGHLTN